MPSTLKVLEVCVFVPCADMLDFCVQLAPVLMELSESAQESAVDSTVPLNVVWLAYAKVLMPPVTVIACR